MAKIFLIKTPDGNLTPSLEQDREALKAYKIGDIVRADVVKPRNGRHHRKAMAMLQYVFENQDRYDEFADFLVEVKLRTGHYYEHLTVKGTIMYLPKSIAFENMDQIEFNEWYNKLINAILKYFITGMTKVQLEEAIQRIIGFF